MTRTTGSCDETSLSLLDGIRARDPQQWDRFVKLFGPLVYRWCCRAEVKPQDAADIVQEVFRAVAEGIDDFRRERAADTFHGWLWGITRHKWQDHFRSLQRLPVAAGGSSANARWQDLPGPFPARPSPGTVSSDAQLIYRRALDLLRTDFEERTWRAFWGVVVDGRKPADVANELGMSPGAVYNAKYKVLNRLREELADAL